MNYCFFFYVKKISLRKVHERSLCISDRWVHYPLVPHNMTTIIRIFVLYLLQTKTFWPWRIFSIRSWTSTMALHIADLYSISVTISSSVHPETSTLQDSYTVSSLDASRFPSVICSWSSTRGWRKVLTVGHCLYASATSVRLPSGSDCFAHAWRLAPEPFPLSPHQHRPLSVWHRGMDYVSCP